ncbi:MAG TPA: hypothetical protein VGI14_13935 [Casimicrobiaceae bacterium]
MRSTLEDINSRVSNGAGRSTVSELVRHARDLASLLDRAVQRLDADADSESARRMAGDLVGHLQVLERDLANRTVQ